VLHLGAIVGEPAEADPALALEVNAVATARLLDLAAARGVSRVVAMSTKGVLGPLDARYLHPSYEPVPVDLAPAPRSVYETTKLVVERLIARARERGLDAAAVRLATTWGPGKSGATHAGFSVHSDVVAAVAAGGSARLDAHPEQGYDLVYYADVAAGLAAACLAARPLARPVYHLGSGRIVTAREFAAAVESAFPGARVELGTRFPPGQNCLLDVGPAAEDFDYRPAWPLARALQAVARRA
jgi:nucleoside-diphosphate-sugar epimerase